MPASASLAEANRRMHEVGGCQDAFVTEDGTTESPVLGWLTDRDIVEALGKQL